MTGVYAIYLRKSRKDMDLEAYGEMETLAKHEKLLMDLAEKQGLNVVKIYREVVSGESIDDRPQMQKLIADVYEGKYDGVLVAEVERLARGATMDQGRVANAFKYSSTKIVTPTKTYDPDNEYDEEYFEFALFMSRKEFKTINRRLQQGKMLAIKEGNYMGSVPPLGYSVHKKGRERTLVPNEQAQIVQDIFRWFVEDRMSTWDIAKKLMTLGVKTKTGKSEWSKNTINGLLHNEVYIGKVRWNHRKTTKVIKDERVVKKSKRLNKKDFILVDGKHQPLVSVEMFERAQEILSQNAIPMEKPKELMNPMAGLLKCKKCGKSMARYPCKQARHRVLHRPSMTCKVKSAFYDDVYDGVISGLEAHIRDFEFKMTNDYELEEDKRRKREVESLKKELAETRAIKDGLFDLFERKVYSEDEFIERKAIAIKRIAELEELIEQHESQILTGIDYTEKIAKFSDVIVALKDDRVSAQQKNDLLKDIVKVIHFENDGKVSLDIILK